MCAKPKILDVTVTPRFTQMLDFGPSQARSTSETMSRQIDHNLRQVLFNVGNNNNACTIEVGCSVGII